MKNLVLIVAPVVMLALPYGLASAEGRWQLQSNIQLGIDAWHIEHSTKDSSQKNMAFMADSLTRWSYREASSWLTLESVLRIKSNGEFVLKAQANASRGAKLNQLSYDHFISPSLGLRVGVLDYRATWCRTYDLDNPWVREADPFCSSSRISLPTDSAPAIQTYTRRYSKDYSVQGLVGSYHPRAFGYAPEEFSDFNLPPSAKVKQNHKLVFSLNAINLYTATEWRLSWIRIRQSLFDPDAVPGFPLQDVPLKYHHKANLWFAGVSRYLTPKVQTRLTYMQSNVEGRCEWLTIQLAPCKQDYRQKSGVIELNYYLNSNNTLSFALTNYNAEQINMVPLKKSVYKFAHQSLSFGWRKDWSPHIFTTFQLTHVNYNQPYRDFAPPDRRKLKGNATGVGFRVGYKL